MTFFSTSNRPKVECRGYVFSKVTSLPVVLLSFVTVRSPGSLTPAMWRCTLSGEMASRRQTWDEWRKRVQRWKESGLTAAEFAAKTGINAGTLQFWKYKLKKSASKGVPAPRSVPAAPDSASIVELRPAATPAVDVRFEIELVCGRRVRVATSTRPRCALSSACWRKRRDPGGFAHLPVPRGGRHATGVGRLAQVARERVGQDPVSSGGLFVFAGRTASRLKVLWFDRNGLCILYKRFHQASVELPAANGQAVVHIDGAALSALLAGTPQRRRGRTSSDRDRVIAS